MATETERTQLEAEWLLGQEAERRFRHDPLLAWRPTARQAPFVRAVLDGPTHTNWMIAANRAGKSEALAYCIARLSRFGDPRERRPQTIWVVSQDYPSSRDIIQPKVFDNGFVPPGVVPFIPAREIAKDGWRVSDQVLRLRNGSLIGWKSSESERVKFAGVEKDAIAFDEEPPEAVHDEAVIRVGAGRRLRVFGAVTLLPPEGQVGGVSWLYPKVIQKAQAGDLPGVGLFGASIYDNPHIAAEEIARLESIYPPGSPQRRIRLEGEWLPGIAGARAYPAFDRRLHVRPQPWPPQPRRPLCWIWDFNVEPLVSFAGQREQGLFRVLREFCLDEGSIGEMCEWLRQELPSGHFGEVWVYGDATGKTRTGQTGQSDYQLILNHMRGWAALRLRVPEANPLVKDRVNAMNRAFRTEQGESLVEIDPSCRELIQDFEQVLVDGRGGIRKTHNRRDSYYRRTHASDAVSYWVAYEEPVRTRPAYPGSPVTRIAPPGYAWSA